jgi:hypothetical protein
LGSCASFSATSLGSSVVSKLFRYLIMCLISLTHSSSSFGRFCFGCSGAGC